MGAKRISNNFSYTAARIVLARVVDGQEVAASRATGFLWAHHDRIYLVTNLHNLSGWDYERDKAMSDVGFMPTDVRVHLAFATAEDGKQFQISRTIVNANLADASGEALWLVHPEHGTKVDVSVISLGNIDVARLWPDVDASKFRLLTLPMNTVSELVDFDVDAGDDAYALGYPLGLHGGEDFPIWKRASIASEPGLSIDGLPKVLIDTATRQGMSGSPVIVIRRGLIPKKGGNVGDMMIGQAPTFLGVYSGRVGDDRLGAQLGVVWKAEVINQIADGLVRGKRPWD
jgi:hypothetical protein